MIDLRPRETVILATDFDAFLTWYRNTLGFAVIKRFDDGYHYANLETPSGIHLGIADAAEMGITPIDRSANTVVLQFEVDDVQLFFDHLKTSGATILNGPAFDKNDNFWFGAFADPEGHPHWVVDKNCP